MRVALVFDPRGNAHALRAVLDAAKARGAHLFVVAGDLAGPGPSPKKVLELLESHGVLATRGPFDARVADAVPAIAALGDPWINATRVRLSKRERRMLRAFPTSRLITIADRALFVARSPDEVLGTVARGI